MPCPRSRAKRGIVGNKVYNLLYNCFELIQSFFQCDDFFLDTCCWFFFFFFLEARSLRKTET